MPPDHSFETTFTRLINTGLLRDNPASLAQSSLKTLTTILTNSLLLLPHDDDNNARYRRIRERNLTRPGGLLTATHAQDVLVALGMTRSVRDFEAWWEFPPLPRPPPPASDDDDTQQQQRQQQHEIEKRQIALRVVRELSAKAAERCEREKRAVERGKNEERERRENVLALIEDDRLRRKEREERMVQTRQALKAAAARQTQQQQAKQGGARAAE
ncbi:hypothetical protein BDZ88DRAFT_176493 [Geranomyces variabilis]|nr:hypothetical protein BDZ88DRAFT_176493 [Geranomyces variabilis]KAJ3138451.1 hypothetical protein HDU90_001415 [Geranomyces variabilis]